MAFARQAAWLLWKDVVVELRAKELVYATVFFAAIVLLVFAFAFLGGPRPTVDVSAGVLWVPVLIAGTRGTVALLSGELAVATYWLKFLLVFDAIFLTIAVRIFEPLLRGDS